MESGRFRMKGDRETIRKETRLRLHTAIQTERVLPNRDTVQAYEEPCMTCAAWRTRGVGRRGLGDPRVFCRRNVQHQRLSREGALSSGRKTRVCDHELDVGDEKRVDGVFECYRLRAILLISDQQLSMLSVDRSNCSPSFGRPILYCITLARLE